MKRPDRYLRALLERHPKLDVVDRALGVPLASFVAALGVVLLLGLPGLLPRTFLLVCFWLLFVVFWAVGWRSMLTDVARNKRRSGPDGG